ncbi:MAG TPA: glycosyltransferase [Candidatus Krumholzibacteria bacterium]|nr:glycosyltransferase [Candidatus Krumholzibacteria bacterium]
MGDGHIRVALVASTLGVGGAERITADVLRRLPADRFRTQLYFLHAAGPVGRSLIADGFDGIERMAEGTHDVAALLKLARLFRRNRPDVVYCLDHHDAMTLGRLAGLASGARAMVVASHATGLVGKSHIFGPVDRMLMDFTGRVVAVSRTHARYLHEHEGLPISSVRVIENGVDAAAYPPVSDRSRAEARAELALGPDEHVIAMVAAMRPEKAHDVLLHALARMRDAGIHAAALLAGDGERRGALEKLADELGLAGSVRFLGVRGDVARLLHAADVVVLPSHAVVETLPLAVLEALAVGVPVVASAVGSIGEVIRDGETGCLIPPADAMALADRVTYILENREAALAMARRGMALVRDRFTIERTTRGYEALFSEMVAA